MYPSNYATLMRMALGMREASLRATGRTSRMISDIAPGDVVIVGSYKTQAEVKRLLRTHRTESEKLEGNVRISVIEPGLGGEALFLAREAGMRRGFGAKVHYAHEWVTDVAEAIITRAAEEIDRL